VSSKTKPSKDIGPITNRSEFASRIRARSAKRFRRQPARISPANVKDTHQNGPPRDTDRLRSLQIILIDSAEFNDSTQKSQLDLAAPANTKVFLFDKDPVKQPKFLALPKDVDDVAGFLHDQEFLPHDERGDSP
jgi:hypothetical protein